MALPSLLTPAAPAMSVPAMGATDTSGMMSLLGIAGGNPAGLLAAASPILAGAASKPDFSSATANNSQSVNDSGWNVNFGSGAIAATNAGGQSNYLLIVAGLVALALAFKGLRP